MGTAKFSCWTGTICTPGYCSGSEPLLRLSGWNNKKNCCQIGPSKTSICWDAQEHCQEETPPKKKPRQTGPAKYPTDGADPYYCCQGGCFPKKETTTKVNTWGHGNTPKPGLSPLEVVETNPFSERIFYRSGPTASNYPADPYWRYQYADMFQALERFIFKRQFWQNMMICGTSENCAWLSML